jgi:hypothetical protein
MNFAARLAVAPRSSERPWVIAGADAAVPVPLASPELGNRDRSLRRKSPKNNGK